jgi:hypothetical protein
MPTTIRKKKSPKKHREREAPEEVSPTPGSDRSLKQFLSGCNFPQPVRDWIAETDEVWLWVILGSVLFYLFIVIIAAI